jgi:hypothetical protein
MNSRHHKITFKALIAIASSVSTSILFSIPALALFNPTAAKHSTVDTEQLLAQGTSNDSLGNPGGINRTPDNPSRVDTLDRDGIRNNAPNSPNSPINNQTPGMDGDFNSAPNNPNSPINNQTPGMDGNFNNAPNSPNSPINNQTPGMDDSRNNTPNNTNSPMNTTESNTSETSRTGAIRGLW